MLRLPPGNGIVLYNPVDLLAATLKLKAHIAMPVPEVFA